MGSGRAAAEAVMAAHLTHNSGVIRSRVSPGVHVSIPTQMSLAGFIATDPDLHFTTAGAEYLRVRVGVEQWRKEVDGSFTKLDPTFHDLVAFESTAREAYARFRRGDSFIASGYIHEYTHERTGEIHEEFVARKIGHNANRTDYEVKRRNLSPAPEQPAPSAERPSPAVGF